MNKLILLILKLVIFCIAVLMMVATIPFAADCGKHWEILCKIFVAYAIITLFLWCLFKEEIRICQDFLHKKTNCKTPRIALNVLFGILPTLITYLLIIFWLDIKII